MLDPETVAQIPEWNARKVSQWERIAGSVPGLQLIRSGPQKSQFMLVCSTPDFYEGVMIGQLGHVMFEATGPSRRPQRKPMPESKKPLDRRGIDLDDAQIQQVIALWRKNKSALKLSFVPAVWGRDGAAKS